MTSSKHHKKRSLIPDLVAPVEFLYKMEKPKNICGQFIVKKTVINDSHTQAWLWENNTTLMDMVLYKLYTKEKKYKNTTSWLRVKNIFSITFLHQQIWFPWLLIQIYDIKNWLFKWVLSG